MKISILGAMACVVSMTVSMNGHAENYTCEESSTYKSGTVDVGRCGYENWVACYEDVEETCRGDSGGIDTRKYRRFTGECVKFVSNCW
jgi:hypothetical protein